MSLTVRGPGMSVAGLRASQALFERSAARLSSGLRIGSASDDAAGLAISERLRSRVTGSAMAARNVSDGISVLQTAEGGLTAITSMVARLRDLSVQAASTGGNSADAREAIAAEVRGLVAEIDRTAGATTFNGRRLLDGSAPGGMTFQIGADEGDTLNVGSTDVRAETLGLLGGTATTTSMATTTSYLTTADKAFSFDTRGGKNVFSVSLDGGPAAQFSVTEGLYGTTAERDALAAEFMSRLASTGLGITVTKTATGNGNKTGFDFAAPGGSAQQITFGGTGALAFGIQTTSTTTTSALSSSSTTQALAELVTAGDSTAIDVCDAALQTVVGARSDLGAVQNRMEHRLSILASTGENLAAARSRIADADMAHEWGGIVRAQLLTQTGSAIQAQAMQGGQRVVQLLGGL